MTTTAEAIREAAEAVQISRAIGFSEASISQDAVDAILASHADLQAAALLAYDALSANWSPYIRANEREVAAMKALRKVIPFAIQSATQSTKESTNG